MDSVRLPDLLRRRLEAEARKAVEASTSVKILNSGLVVGGLTGNHDSFDPHSRDGADPYLSYPDSTYMWDIADVLPGYGYALSPDMAVYVMNANNGAKEDFLRAASLPVDFALFAHVYESYSEDDDEYDSDEGLIRVPDNPHKTRSFYSYDAKLWHQKLMQSGASVAVNVQSYTSYKKGIWELPTAWLENPFSMAAEVKNYSARKVCDILIRDYPASKSVGFYKKMGIP